MKHSISRASIISKDHSISSDEQTPDIKHRICDDQNNDIISPVAEIEIFYQESGKEKQQQNTSGHINKTFSLGNTDEITIDIEDCSTGSLEMKQTELTTPVDDKDFTHVNLESEKKCHQ